MSELQHRLNQALSDLQETKELLREQQLDFQEQLNDRRTRHLAAIDNHERAMVAMNAQLSNELNRYKHIALGLYWKV